MYSEANEIYLYLLENGQSPFWDWLTRLRDRVAKRQILNRIDRAKRGNLGTYRSVGQGVFELKIDSGPGYRVYFGRSGENIILLLCGGDKNSQEQDIRQAKAYWRDYGSSDRNTPKSQTL